MKNNLFFLLFLGLFIFIPLINADFPDNTQGIYYNFTHPNGVLGNPNLIWNDGTGSSGVVMNGTTIQNRVSKPLDPYIITGEVTPIGLQNSFNFNDGSKVGFIDVNSRVPNTKSKVPNTNQSLSYFAWVKRSTPLTAYTFTGYVTPMLSSLANKTGDLYLDFYMFSSTYHNAEQSGSPTINFDMGFLNEANQINCSTAYANYTILRDSTKYHLIGFVYNYSNILSGDLVKIYYDGVMIKNCSTHTLSGTATLLERKELVMGVIPGAFQIARPSDLLWYPAPNSMKINNVGLWTYALNTTDIQTLNSSSYFPGGASPTLFDPFDDVYDVTNGSILLNMSDYFSTNYDSIQIHYHDNFINGTDKPITLFKQTSNTTDITNKGSVNLTLSSDGFYQSLYMEKGVHHYAGQVYVNAGNQYGNTTDFFALYYYTNQSFFNGTYINGTILGGGAGIFGGLVNFFSSIFPDSSGLSSSIKFTYVIVTLLLITIAILIVGKEFMGTALILALILDSLLFLYFVFIGYVPFGIILIMGLLGVIASFLKFKSGGT